MVEGRNDARVIEQGWVKIGGKQALKMLWNLAKNNAVKERQH